MGGCTICSSSAAEKHYLFIVTKYIKTMAPVKTKAEIEKAARKTIEALYGTDIRDFKIRVLFPFPSELKHDSWDVQVTFLQGKLQSTVDLMIQENDGKVTNARLIDTMMPL